MNYLDITYILIGLAFIGWLSEIPECKKFIKGLLDLLPELIIIYFWFYLSKQIGIIVLAAQKYLDSK